MRDLISRQAAIDIDGLDVEIRCEMCKNPMHTDRGCDGNCKYDEKLYEKIIQILDERIKPLPSAQPNLSEDELRLIKKLRSFHNGTYAKVLDKLIASVRLEIVRCKDCKFYTPMNRETKNGICRLLMHQNFGDDWYCAGAERMEE